MIYTGFIIAGGRGGYDASLPCTPTVACVSCPAIAFNVLSLHRHTFRFPSPAVAPTTAFLQTEIV